MESNVDQLLCAKLDCLEKPDGSAMFSINDTKQICAVYGPGEVKIMKELADKAYLNVTYKPRIGMITNKEKVIEYSIKSICDGAILSYIHPRTCINIVLQELETDGNQLACAVNAVCLALLDANIPLKYSFGAVHCAMLKETNEIVNFPTVKQEKESALVVTFVFDSIENDLMFVNTNGLFDKLKFGLLMESAKAYANQKLFTFFNQQISNKYEK